MELGWVIIIFAFREFKGRYQAHCTISYINGLYCTFLGPVSTGEPCRVLGSIIPGFASWSVCHYKSGLALRITLTFDFKTRL